MVKSLKQNPSKKGIRAKAEIKNVRIEFGDKVCYRCHKRGIFNILVTI